MLAHQEGLLNLNLVEIPLLAKLFYFLLLLLGCHLLQLHLLYLLLDSLVVPLLETEDFLSTLLRLLNFLPCLKLFLFEEGNTVGEELGIAINATF